jgi:hypothetical protein
VASAGVAVSAAGAVGGLALPLVCPQTDGVCDTDGNLALALTGSSARGAHAITTVSDSVIARFAGVQIDAGHSRLVSVHLTPAATRYLQTRGVRSVRVTLTISNHLVNGSTVTTAQQVLLNIAPLQAACPAASGSLTATSIGGQLRLGMTRAQAHRVGRARRAPYGFERYCLEGGKIRVAAPVAALVRRLSVTQRRRVAGRVIIELTGNRHYAIRGVTAHTKLSTAAHKLNLGTGITVGRNTWYLVSSRTRAWVFKVQAGTIDEIGVVAPSLTRTAAQRRYLVRHL